MKNTITTIAIASTLVAGGTTIELNNQLDTATAELTAKTEQIETLETALVEKDNVIEQKQYEKHIILKDYVNSEVRLSDIPNPDFSYVTPEELQQAYIDIINEKGISYNVNDTDIYNKLRLDIVNKGQACVPIK